MNSCQWLDIVLRTAEAQIHSWFMWNLILQTAVQTLLKLCISGIAPLRRRHNVHKLQESLGFFPKLSITIAGQKRHTDYNKIKGCYGMQDGPFVQKMDRVWWRHRSQVADRGHAHLCSHHGHGHRVRGAWRERSVTAVCRVFCFEVKTTADPSTGHFQSLRAKGPFVEEMISKGLQSDSFKVSTG